MLRRAVDDRNVRGATVLALAAASAGARIPAPLVMRIAPDLDDIQFFPPIVSAVDGDRMETLLDLAATERLSWEREAVVLYLAARLLDGAQPPRRLTSRLRSLLREATSDPAAIVAGMAAFLVDDPEVRAVAGDSLALGALGKAKGLDDLLWNQFERPVLESLPEQEMRHGPTVTVVRSEPKVGRNDPCPCGSGRKYKKCCAGKAQAAPLERSLVEQFHDLGDRSPRVRQQLFESMRPADLERLDAHRLTTSQLILGMRDLAVHHRWDAAERFMDVLATRQDVPHEATADGHRIDLIEMAMDAGNVDLVERQMAVASVDDREREVFAMRLAVVRGAPDALSRIETVLRRGHVDDPNALIECAYTLLRDSPALGILAARGLITADRPLDSEELLRAIGHARDVLGLPADEPWQEVFELLLDSRFGRFADELDEDEHLRDAEIQALRTKLRAAADRARRTGEELARRERQLEAVSSEREKLAAAIEAKQNDDGGGVVELEQERQRLRRKISELQGKIAEGAEQRAELRRELARSADERSRKAGGPAAQPEQPPVDEAEGDAVEMRPRRILVPHYANAASRSLAAVPAHVAAAALRECADLAGGDERAWSGVKHMRRAHEILSVRVGRTWRLLFRVLDDRLDVLELVHRRELDNAIARLSR